MSSLAVVILNYNGKALLGKFLPTVISHTPGAQIVVADNGSSDGSIEFVRTSFPTVTIIAIPSNLGFCGGYNYSLSRVDATYYVLLNSDVEVTPAWSERIVRLFEARKEIAAAQPKILSHANKTYFEYAGAGGGLIDTFGYPFCRGRLFDHLEEDHGQYDDQQPIFWATGACMFVRASAYHHAGGLDEDFFAHMEEIDLCWRLKRDGHEIFYDGSSAVYHVGGATLDKVSPKKTYYNFRNGLYLIVKHLSPGALMWKFPLRIVLDWLAALTFIFKSPAHSLAVVKAHFRVLAEIGNLLRKRAKLAKQLRGYEVSGTYHGSIVLDFYLKGRKTYRDLPSSPK